MLRAALAIAAACAAAIAGPHASAADPIRFNRQISPILSDNCFTCHGPDKASRASDLRLDQEASAKDDLGGYRAIVPRDRAASEVWKRITSTDPDVQMPPPKSGRKLSRDQIELIGQWIDQGAPWQKHWALLPPDRPTAPSVAAADWPRGAIDRFILAKIEAAGLVPAPEAARETLLRRVTLDLTGLPPTPEELDAFLADPSPDAYERAVDRLLASPRYGERMVLEWLDAARYADTNGYQTDGTRTMWPWRDLVIGNLNRNQPFDEFTIEQLAGDLLPQATRQQRLASGFHRNHMLNGEGGRIAEESRVEYVVDRVETTAAVWLGLTLGCCRCHDHKYDPFTQREFYGLYAFFNNIEESGGVDRGGNAAPVMKLPTPAQEQQLARYDEQLAALDAKIQSASPPPAEEQDAWEAKARLEALVADAGGWQILTPDSLASREKVTLTARPDRSIFASGPNPEQDVYTVTAKTDATNITGLRLEALPDPTHTARGLARSDSGNFVLTEIEIEAAGARVAIAAGKADFEQGGFKVEAAFDGNNGTGWAVHNPSGMEQPRTAVFTFAQPIGGGPSTLLTIRLKHESVHKHHNLGLFRLAITTREKPSLDGKTSLPDAVAAALRIEPADRTEAQRTAIAQHFQMLHQQRLGDERKALQKARADFEKGFLEAMVMAERAQPRDTRILIRGQYDRPGEPVAAATPEQLHAWPEDAPRNRLGLARWLVSRSNPLLARVTVNRYWQQFFGVGLVKSPEDFGFQAELPSHPELLDWLAVEFATDWDVKRLHRLIVISSTYRQASNLTAEARERDPDNRLLARFPRLRLPSQMLRDQALMVSGLLVEQVGGAPVKPYQPPGIWEDFSFGQIRYVQDHGEKLYRRSLYTFWRRSVAPTSLFDISGRTVCTVKLPRTNTPLQSLILWNDVTYAEAARALAERLLHETATDDTGRLRLAFRQLTARAPNAAETALLTAALARLRGEFAAQPERAKQVLAAGEAPRDERLDPTEHAAWSALCGMLFNLDESLVKE